MKNKQKKLIAITVLVIAAALTAPSMAENQLRAQTIGSQRTILLDFTDTNVTDQEIDFINQTYTTEITPDSFWYGFKRLGEGFRLMFTFDPIEKVKLHLRFAQERLAEANHMAEKGDHERVGLLVWEYEQEVNETDQELEHSKGIGRNVSVLVRDVEDRLLKSIYVLQLVYERVPDSAKPAIEHVINKSLEKRIKTEEMENNWTREQREERIRDEMEKHEQRWLSMEEKFQEKLDRKLSEVEERIEEAQSKNQTEKIENLQHVREQINESIDRKLRQIEEKREEFNEKFQKKLVRLNRTHETDDDENDTEENNTQENHTQEITGNVLVSTSELNYTANETINITVKNNLSEKLYYDGCGSFRHKQIIMENKINETWSETNGTQDWFVCMLAVEQQSSILEENDTISFFTGDNQTLQAGTYRAGFDYETALVGNWSRAYSSEFAVE